MGAQQGCITWLDRYTAKKLKHDLHLHSSLIIPSKPTSSQINRILNQIYIPSKINKDDISQRYPEWLRPFLTHKIYTKDQKNQFVSKYGSVLKLNHTINAVISDKDNELVKEYYNKIKLPKVVPFDNISKFQLLRSQYNGFLIKKKTPDLSIQIDLTSFGLPPSPEVIFNKYFNQLYKLQKHFKENAPLLDQDFQGLQNIDIHSLPDVSRESYIVFLQTLFKIEAETGKIIKLNILEKSTDFSEKVVNLYKKYANNP